MEEPNPFNDGPTVDLQNVRRQKQLRQPPHSIEAECGVLGCILLSSSECIPICIDKFKDRSDVFYDLRHRAVYEMLVSLYDQQKPIDLITVQQALRDSNQLQRIGGVVYLSSLPDSVPSAANLDYYIDIVKEKHALRCVIDACADMAARAYEFNGEVPDLLDRFAHDANKIAQSSLVSGDNAGPRSLKQLAPAAIQTMERIYLAKDSIIGLATGFHDFDKMTLGLHPGEINLIAARPSLGKSSLAMNIAEYVGGELKKPVGVFSLEMSADSLMLRMICSAGRVNLRNVMHGDMAAGDFPKVKEAIDYLSKAPVFIDDSRGLSILQLKAKSRQLKQQKNIQLLIVDYVQLVHSTNHRAQNREQEVRDVSAGLKELAGELALPIIVLAQLNREMEKGSRKPRLSDLRESGALEADADLVAMLYRPDGDDDYHASQNDAARVNLLVNKQRNGPTGEIPLVFLRPCTRFESATKKPKDDPTENFPEP